MCRRAKVAHRCLETNSFILLRKRTNALSSGHLARYPETEHLWRRNPVDIWCQNDVISTSTRRYHVASTLIRRHFTSCARWENSLLVLSATGHWCKPVLSTYHQVAVIFTSQGYQVRFVPTVHKEQTGLSNLGYRRWVDVDQAFGRK